MERCWGNGIKVQMDETTLAFFGAGREGCFHCIDYLWLKSQPSPWSRNHWSNQILLWSDLPVRFWSGVRRCGTHWAEAFIMPGSLCRIFSTHTQHMLVALTIWFIVNCLSSVWWVQSKFLLSVGSCQMSWVIFKTLHSPSKFSCPLLHCW